jgi:hypothetical protein
MMADLAAKGLELVELLLEHLLLEHWVVMMADLAGLSWSS